MIDKISVVMPCEEDRIKLLLNTISVYMQQGLTNDIEFIIVSRTIKNIAIPTVRMKLIKYEYEGEYFNPAMALNLGVKNATYENIIITCPEVFPLTNVLEQLRTHIRGNYVCQVFDQNEFGKRTKSLVNSNFRGETPSMYFLAMFKKEDIEAINGWDEDFMGGYCFEDDDFGYRFNKFHQGNFKVLDGVQAEHKYHSRCSDRTPGFNRNHRLFKSNVENNIIRPKNGLEKI